MAKLRAVDVRMEYYQPRTGSRLLAIDRLNMAIEEGEFVSVVGPSGCGKSTLLKIVDGLCTPTGGQVLLDGRAVSRPGRDRAVVFQDASLFPWYTVLGNVSYGLECHGARSREARQRAQPFIELVGLAGFEHHYPYELSGGMQQRVNLARALAVDPELLLMDEPFAALDEVTRFKLNDDLVALKRDLGATIVFVTHSIYESAFLSTRIVVMSKPRGRIVEEIDIDPALVRDAEFRMSEAFTDICRRASRALREATGEAA